MANFKNVLTRLKVAERTVPYTIFAISFPNPEGGEVSPTLQVLSSTDRNEGYLNDLLKSRSVQARAKVRTPNSKMLKAARAEDVRLFAKHVIKGWSNMYDDSAVVVPFSVTECESFLTQLVDSAPEIFDELRAFCGDIDNFRESAIDQEGIAKN